MFDLSKRILDAREKQLTDCFGKSIVAGELIRDVAKARMNCGDRRAHDLAITAKLAIEDLKEHLAGRAK